MESVMPKKPATQKQLMLELEDLRARLDEAEETLRAIRSGEVDALIVSGVDGEQIFTLKGADRSYRLLIEDMNEGALMLTMDGIILYANRHFGEMLKTPLEKVIGSTIHDWITPTDQKVLQALLQPDDAQAHHREVTMLAGDGTFVQCYFSSNVSQTEDIPGVICLIATDLTEQKHTEAIAASEKTAQELLAAANQSRRALLSVIEDQKLSEETLRESEQRFRSLIENASDIIYELSLEGIFTYLSPNWLDLIGEPAAEAVGKSFELYVHLDDYHLIWEFLERILKTEKRQTSADYRVLHRDGSIHCFSTNASAVHDMAGNIIGHIGIARDITERKQAEMHLETARRRYSELFQNITIGVCRTTPGEKGTFIDVNPAMVKMFEADDKDHVLSHKPNDIYLDAAQRIIISDMILSRGFIEGLDVWFKTLKGRLTPDVNSGHEVFSCRYIPFIELPLVLSGR
jgi:PAS domain S-box-containing protein